MKRLLITLATLFTLNYAMADETIVVIRHGEKPKSGLGQLNCQGLNRSLKLPMVLIEKFGKPDAIYASNPGVLKSDSGVDYYYIRPLATIEPTAVRLGMPVNLKYDFKQHIEMTNELLQDKYKNATIFVTWEHHLAAQIVQDILKKINGSSEKIDWDNDDYDSIYLVTVENGLASLVIDKQGLNGQSKICP